MSADIKIDAQRRTKSGSTECRRLRRQGRIPANVFGHKQAAVPISIDREAFRPVLLTGHKVIDLTIDGASEKALVREVQWDTFGAGVQHIDFQRVDVTERMSVDVPVVLRGTARGVVEGGILNHHLHSLRVEATAVTLPDLIEIRVNDLGIGQSIHVSDVTGLPEGVTIETPAELVVVQVAAAVEMAEIAGAEEGGPLQPELVGRKAAEAEGGEN
ncbi:MAG: 50S ribosomal protein L25 [Planctomycetaceae bacterium]|nr:50S ribosomal protein L25 [Planctomycetaceae bacterium]